MSVVLFCWIIIIFCGQAGSCVSQVLTLALSHTKGKGERVFPSGLVLIYRNIEYSRMLTATLFCLSSVEITTPDVFITSSLYSYAYP